MGLKHTSYSVTVEFVIQAEEILSNQFYIRHHLTKRTEILKKEDMLILVIPSSLTHAEDHLP